MFNYVVMFYNGDGIGQNKKEAARYFKLAADKRDIKLMKKYSKMLSKGEGIEKCFLKEADRYRKLASKKTQ